MRDILIDKRTEGGRLDKAVLKYLDRASAGFVYKMLRKKNILLNEAKAKGNEILKAGDVIRLYLAEETIETFRSETHRDAKDQRLKDLILYEDDDILVFRKPAGMLSQKSRPGDVSADDLVKAYLGADELFTPGISNRLDRNTSGLMIAGKHPAAVRLLNEAIRTRAVKKEYLCVVRGTPKPSEGLLSHVLTKDTAANQVKIDEKAQDPDGAKPVQTAYRVLSSNQRVSLLLVELLTGKTHQIRAHLAYIGHPIVGDPKYGEANDPVRRQLLHSYRLSFVRMTGILSRLNGLSITCPLPQDMSRFIKGEQLCLHGDPEDSGDHSLKA